MAFGLSIWLADVAEGARRQTLLDVVQRVLLRPHSNRPVEIRSGSLSSLLDNTCERDLVSPSALVGYLARLFDREAMEGTALQFSLPWMVESVTAALTTEANFDSISSGILDSYGHWKAISGPLAKRRAEVRVDVRFFGRSVTRDDSFVRGYRHTYPARNDEGDILIGLPTEAVDLGPFPFHEGRAEHLTAQRWNVDEFRLLLFELLELQPVEHCLLWPALQAGDSPFRASIVFHRNPLELVADIFRGLLMMEDWLDLLSNAKEGAVPRRRLAYGELLGGDLTSKVLRIDEMRGRARVLIEEIGRRFPNLLADPSVSIKCLQTVAKLQRFHALSAPSVAPCLMQAVRASSDADITEIGGGILAESKAFSRGSLRNFFEVICEALA
jgi:hypothetical protein